jgi:hypothetical protein
MWTAACRVQFSSSPSAVTSIRRDKIVRGVRFLCSCTTLYLVNIVAFLLYHDSFPHQEPGGPPHAAGDMQMTWSASEMTNVTRSLIP